MAEISAQAVKALRDRTGLPMMECKSALAEAQGDEERAIEILRKRGLSTAAKRADRETSEGRIASCVTPTAGAIIELRCESAPVANSEGFRQLAAALAEVLAAHSQVADGEALLNRPDPKNNRQTLRDLFSDVQNRLREHVLLARVLRWEGITGNYVHHDGRQAALVRVNQAPSNPQLLKELCMHVVSLRPLALSAAEIDAAVVAKEREILTEQARSGGKPASIVEKMVDGRMRHFFAERVLVEQPFALDASKTVGQVLQEAGIEVKQFVRWEVGAAD